MNKQLIQKLLDKSCYDETEQQDLEDWCNVEKFAELIVRECALTLYKNSIQDQKAGFDHEARIMELAGDLIKQHFGVE